MEEKGRRHAFTPFFGVIIWSCYFFVGEEKTFLEKASDARQNFLGENLF